MQNIAILYPADPLGHVPSGIDSFVRGFLKWAPEDLRYTLFGASSDMRDRPLRQEYRIGPRNRSVFVPIVSVSPSSRRKMIPLIVRYTNALRHYQSAGLLDKYQILDFHRLEPALLFRRDCRPKNLVMHQDVTGVRDNHSEIAWRHIPWLYEKLEDVVFPSISRFFSVRQTSVDLYGKVRPSVRGRIEYLRTWVDTDVFRPARSAGERASDRLAVSELITGDVGGLWLVYVGRLDFAKDPALLVESFANVANENAAVRLLMVGDGKLREKVEAMIKERRLSRQVHLLGAQPPSTVAKILRASDLFVLSSAYEGMPIAMLEALACGLPVVSTDVGEVKAVVRDGVNGALAVGRSPNELSNAIMRSLDALSRIQGQVCVDSVQQYRPDLVLGRLFENHRRQIGLVSS